MKLKISILFSSFLACLAPARADFALRDGDTVVFLGDSITDGGNRRIRCVDCHLPNGNHLVHYVWKSIDGMKDVISFNTGMVPERITLSSHGAKVVQSNCIRCHTEAVSQMDTTRQCWGCHRQLRHRLTGIAAAR